MPDLTELVAQALEGETLDTLGQRVGADPQRTRTAALAALPVLLGAMKRNASSPQGAAALDAALEKDHDGSLLDQLGGFLSGRVDNERAANGDGILEHVLGREREPVQQGISRASGLDLSQVARLLPLIAPIVMGALGKEKRDRNADAGGLEDLLGSATENARQRAPSGALDALSAFLDADGDGDIKDDLLKRAGSSVLGKLFGR